MHVLCVLVVGQVKIVTYQIIVTVHRVKILAPALTMEQHMTANVAVAG